MTHVEEGKKHDVDCYYCEKVIIHELACIRINCDTCSGQQHDMLEGIAGVRRWRGRSET